MIKRGGCLAVTIVYVLALIIALTAIQLSPRSAHGRDLDGRYKNSPLKGWFNSLKNKNGVGCCDTADGVRVEDAEWGIDNQNRYWVFVDGVRHVVPPEALITSPNRVGVAIVWPMQDQTGAVVIRCFIPGVLT